MQCCFADSEGKLQERIRLTKKAKTSVRTRKVKVLNLKDQGMTEDIWQILEGKKKDESQCKIKINKHKYWLNMSIGTTKVLVKYEYSIALAIHVPVA